jgi:hypothetical protein
MKRLLLVLVLVTIGAAYLAGYWPEHQARKAAEQQLDGLRARLERAEARNRLYDLQGQLLTLTATMEARNFGEAQAKATAFFESVRAESGRTRTADTREALERILSRRDRFTVALTQSDPAAPEMVHRTMADLRSAIGLTPLPAPPAESVGTGDSHLRSIPLDASRSQPAPADSGFEPGPGPGPDGS